ncbi:MAG TPA: hypothetical protein VGK81_10915 [Anaerolineae bacterium]
MIDWSNPHLSNPTWLLVGFHPSRYLAGLVVWQIYEPIIRPLLVRAGAIRPILDSSTVGFHS